MQETVFYHVTRRVSRESGDGKGARVQFACMGVQLCYNEIGKQKYAPATIMARMRCYHIALTEIGVRLVRRYHSADTPFLLSIRFWSNICSQWLHVVWYKGEMCSALNVEMESLVCSSRTCDKNG